MLEVVMSIAQPLLFAILFLLMAALPFIPAIRELLRPTDCAPLDVYQGNSADAAEPFKADNPGPACLQFSGEHTIAAIPAGVTHVRGESLTVHGSTVAKLSASEQLVIAEGARFLTAQAPVIRFGLGDTPTPESAPRPTPLKEGRVDQAVWQPLQKWWHALVPARISSGSKVIGDVLVPELVIEAGAQVVGSLKVAGDLVIGPDCEIQGNCVAHVITLGPRARVSGCVVADVVVRMEQGATVGSAALPASVLATHLQIEPGATVYGGVTAHGEAHVLESKTARTN